MWTYIITWCITLSNSIQQMDCNHIQMFNKRDSVIHYYIQLKSQNNTLNIRIDSVK